MLSMGEYVNMAPRCATRTNMMLAGFGALLLRVLQSHHFNIPLIIPRSNSTRDLFDVPYSLMFPQAHQQHYENTLDSARAEAAPEASQTGSRLGVTGVKSATIGRNKKPTLAIAGPARSMTPYLQGLYRSVQRLQHNFEIVQFAFFENDSRDNTTVSLQQWGIQLGVPVAILSEKGLSSGGSRLKVDNRTTILAHVRNELWKLIDTSPHYVLMIDTDEVNLELRGVHHCLDLPHNWSGCCANQYHLFYDLWALRAKGWVEGNIRDLPHRLRVLAQRHISAREEPILVESCFGGATLYNYKAMHQIDLKSGDLYHGIDYSASKGQSFTCEHVSFHRHLLEHNLSMFIQPKMLNHGPYNLLRKKTMIKFRNTFELSWNDSALSEYYAPVSNFLWNFF